MNRTVRLANNRTVTVVSADDLGKAINPNDIEMDIRAKEAVKSAINRAKICKKPVAKYDKESKKVYMETVDGKKIYVG